MKTLLLVFFTISTIQVFCQQQDILFEVKCYSQKVDKEKGAHFILSILNFSESVLKLPKSFTMGPTKQQGAEVGFEILYLDRDTINISNSINIDIEPLWINRNKYDYVGKLDAKLFEYVLSEDFFKRKGTYLVRFKLDLYSFNKKLSAIWSNQVTVIKE